MTHDARAYLWDIQEAARAIERFVSGMDWQAFQQDEVVRSAVERKLEIIGEAIAQLDKLDSALAGDLSAKRQIVGMRNVLIHGYASIDEAIVWQTIEADVPRLQEEVTRLLSELSGAGDSL